MVDLLHDAVIGVDPDFTILLDIDPETALHRTLARSPGGAETRMEGKGVALQTRAKEIRLQLADEESRFCRIEADRDPGVVSREVASAVEQPFTHTSPSCEML